MATHQDNRPVIGGPPLVSPRGSRHARSIRISLGRYLSDNYRSYLPKLLTLSGVVDKLYVASRKKKCEAMILIRTHMDVVSVMEFDAIPDGVIILDSYEMQIDQEIQHMQAGRTTA